MSQQAYFLAVDIGPITLSMVKMDFNGSILGQIYLPHQGRVESCFSKACADFKGTDVIVGTSGCPAQIPLWNRYNSQISYIKCAQHFYPELRSLLMVGGERFSLVLFDDEGHYKESRNNTACAAGTGSFLDQQARRLGFKDSAELAGMALSLPWRLQQQHQQTIPQMASRCAVFAKTDLLHAQQEGYSSEAISSGLCLGLSKNLADTLFKGEKLPSPIVMAGGVARNLAVKKYLEEILGESLIVDQYAPLYSAIGSGLLFLEEVKKAEKAALPISSMAPDQLVEPKKNFYYPPLEIKFSTYPSFEKKGSYLFKNYLAVEVEKYMEVEKYIETYNSSINSVYLGIDVGSTSTKAILIDDQKRPVLGVYTRTSGRPAEALQALLAAIDDWGRSWGVFSRIAAIGTTGAGRKFIGKLMNADLVVDEITAHAKAAYTLNNSIDTIFEIGGQDAKFTTMQNGRVTFSLMNNVCAAGTGSFIEEQALKLGVKLEDISALAMGTAAPLASDCCTVFMERDLNHHISNGYSINEILATILHSVRENYLRKVVQNGKVGENICFQGATAKNQALIATFEQKLECPIFVSKYCHLTGALGVAELLVEEQHAASATQDCDQDSTRDREHFLRSYYQQQLVIRQEVCNLCNNHCKLRLLDIDGEVFAYGLLCGRDYAQQKIGPKFKRQQHNLLSIRKQLWMQIGQTQLRSTDKNRPTIRPTIGLPAALYLYEEIPFWANFFSKLGFPLVTTESCKQATNQGKSLARAEFCAPIANFFGQIFWLAERCDHIFMPVHLEGVDDPMLKGAKPKRRQYCYYGQYSSGLIASIELPGDGPRLKEKCLTPVLRTEMHTNTLNIKLQLYQLLTKELGGRDLSFLDIHNAYDESERYQNDFNSKLQTYFLKKNDEAKKRKQLSVVLLGRPYTILNPEMNKGIPEIFADLQVECFFQDMIAYASDEADEIAELIKHEHWHYSSKILAVSNKVAKTDGLYPVLITSFKCAPDSCTIDHFRRIMDHYQKPYLIIQLDEHNSSVGYETRIESALRAFSNHYYLHSDNDSIQHKLQNRSQIGKIEIANKLLQDKIVLLPIWDQLVVPLIVANLRGAGLDARALEEDSSTISRSLQLNTGQCLPLSAIIQGTIDFIKKYQLDPAKVVLWVLKSHMACNIGAYPSFIKRSFEGVGKGMEKIEIFSGEFSFIDVSLKVSINHYFTLMFGGMLRCILFKIRPYEKFNGDTDRVLKSAMLIFEEAFLGKISKLNAVKMVVKLFTAIETVDVASISRPRMKVAIIGDMYVRENEVMNQDLARFIEQNGGEVAVHSTSEMIKIISNYYLKKWIRERKFSNAIIGKSVLTSLKWMERDYLVEFAKVLGPSILCPPQELPANFFEKFNLGHYHTGESFDNILAIFHLLKSHPDIGLVVQTNPAYCCPSLITEAMSKQIENILGVPMVSITYDGTLSFKNETILPHLKFSYYFGLVK
ncbi:MAG: CoA activase [Oligoflexia bacterium]|nr:CoA activase [Oligoflexia bacterium]